MPEQVDYQSDSQTLTGRRKKYNELLTFELDVKNIFMTKSYDISKSEIVQITMTWLGHEGLHFVQN